MNTQQEDLYRQIQELTKDYWIKKNYTIPNFYRVSCILKDDGIIIKCIDPENYLIISFLSEDSYWKIDKGELFWFTGGTSNDLDDLSNWHCDRIELNCSQYRFDGNKHFVVILLCDREYIIIAKSKELNPK